MEEPKIHAWMKPFIEDYGMHPEVVRILGREGISEDVLEALKSARTKGETMSVLQDQGCKQSPSEAAEAMREPNWWQRWRLRRLVNQVIREHGVKGVAVSHVVEGVLKQGMVVTVDEVTKMYEEVK